MSSSVTELPTKKKYTPYVPETMQMKEFTLRALLIGLVMTAILGSANAYLGLKAGMTIAATYPAAVIGMALLRLMKGSLLEENIARTVGSIGESVAAGAVFTIPRNSVCDPAAKGHGRGSGTSVSRVGGGIGDSQSRSTGREGCTNSLCQHGLWRLHVSARSDQRFQCE